MPIQIQYPLRSINREEFGELAYRVLNDLFVIHNEMGRLFEENTYQRALATMRSDILLEVWIDVSHSSFKKRFFIDIVADGSGIVELKAVDVLTPRHQSQLLQYLMLANLTHGMLVNVRPSRIERRFVNNALPLSQRQIFDVRDTRWDDGVPGARSFRDRLLAVVSDWGTGLELALYDEALTHFLGGPEVVERRVKVFWMSRPAGTKLVRLAAPQIAFQLTALKEPDAQSRFAEHLKRLIRHSALDAVLWANIVRSEVGFRTLTAD